MNYKKYSIQLLVTAGIFSMLLVSASFMVLFIYDPLQLQSEDYYDADKFLAKPSMRLQAKGIINKVDFDSVFLGTSMLENSSALEASRLLNSTFVNLSIHGSNFYERAFILNYLFEHKKIKNIIYSVDDFYFDLPRNTKQIDQWELLYDGNPINDMNVLFSATYIRPTIEYIKNNLNKSYKLNKAGIEFFDKPNDWADLEYDVALFGGLENWITDLGMVSLRDFLLRQLPKIIVDIKSTPQSSFEDAKINKQIDYIDTYLLSYVKNNPDTKFYLVFPPYYRYRYAEWMQVGGEKYFIHQKIIKYLVSMSEKYQNLYIYGFEDLNYLDIIENYKDPSHYNRDMNSLITHAIAEKKHLLTIDNVDSYLNKSAMLAKNFDVQKLHDQTRVLLRQKGYIK